MVAGHANANHIGEASGTGCDTLTLVANVGGTQGFAIHRGRVEDVAGLETLSTV